MLILIFFKLVESSLYFWKKKTIFFRIVMRWKLPYGNYFQNFHMVHESPAHIIDSTILKLSITYLKNQPGEEKSVDRAYHWLFKRYANNNPRSKYLASKGYRISRDSVLCFLIHQSESGYLHFTLAAIFTLKAFWSSFTLDWSMIFTE